MEDSKQSLMNINEGLSYLMVGLQNAIGRSNNVPSYKILLGSGLQGAIRKADGKRVLWPRILALS